jgi:hypothetical protein
MFVFAVDWLVLDVTPRRIGAISWAIIAWVIISIGIAVTVWVSVAVPVWKAIAVTAVEASAIEAAAIKTSVPAKASTRHGR